MVRESDYTGLADASWSRLRMVIAEEFISKLPTTMTVEDVSRLLRMPGRDIRGRIRTGEIIARDSEQGLCIVPADNRAFFRRDMLLHLPLPDPRRADAPSDEWLAPAVSTQFPVL